MYPRPEYVSTTFLTSYVLATVCRARHFIQVDSRVVSDAFSFLESRRMASGQFDSKKRSYNTRQVTVCSCYSLLTFLKVSSVFV